MPHFEPGSGFRHHTFFHSVATAASPARLVTASPLIGAIKSGLPEIEQSEKTAFACRGITRQAAPAAGGGAALSLARGAILLATRAGPRLHVTLWPEET